MRVAGGRCIEHMTHRIGSTVRCDDEAARAAGRASSACSRELMAGGAGWGSRGAAGLWLWGREGR